MPKGSTLGKDPAVSWVFNDWQGGTMTLTRHQKGCYMDLLTAQFNNGHLSLEEIKNVLGNDFAAWGVLSKKFKKDSEEKFYNERLEFEIIKRKNYNESRRVNALSKKSRDNLDEHMPQHMGIGKGNSLSLIPGDKEDFLSNQIWKESFCMAKGLSMKDLETMQAKFIKDVELKGEQVDSLKKYFTNWYNKNTPMAGKKKGMVI